MLLDKDKLPRILKECFLLYNKKVDKTIEKYVFNYTENTSVYNFSKFLKEKHLEYITIEWIFDYLNFQFSFWNFHREQKKLKEGKEVDIKLNWIFGNKGLKRFNQRTERDTYFYHTSFFPKYKIKKSDLENLLESKGFILENEENEEDSFIENDLNLIEESRKDFYYNKDEGFLNCISYTTLFKFESTKCRNCLYKDKCKTILKKRYPKLYQIRVANKIRKGSNGK